ncbi:DUF6137 domain-containing protein [Paenibacillus sp. KS-LC4]|uniref:DUF6137 domain-containing protein n=1 Tax=Paenibacillus sp. KS-LC4 TaxID=2979727 RepID=UPI0030CDEC8C
MNKNVLHYRQHIIHAISGVTGMDGDELQEMLQSQPLEMDKRDYFEIVQRIESFFDCTLDFEFAEPYQICMDRIIERLVEIDAHCSNGTSYG